MPAAAPPVTRNDDVVICDDQYWPPAAKGITKRLIENNDFHTDRVTPFGYAKHLRFSYDRMDLVCVCGPGSL